MRELLLHRGRVGALAWAGHTLATGGQDRRIVLSDLRAPDPTARLAGHRAEVCGLKVCRGAGSMRSACTGAHVLSRTCSNAAARRLSAEVLISSLCSTLHKLPACFS